jgi:circadian clock protein KaiB
MSAQNSGGEGFYRFVLYIDSEKRRSTYVVHRLREVCQDYLPGSYTMELVDLRENQALFEEKRIIAVPTLEVTAPDSRQHRFVGDLSESEIFIVAIGMGREADRMGRQARKMGRDAVRMRSRVKTPDRCRSRGGDRSGEE